MIHDPGMVRLTEAATRSTRKPMSESRPLFKQEFMRLYRSDPNASGASRAHFSTGSGGSGTYYTAKFDDEADANAFARRARKEMNADAVVEKLGVRWVVKVAPHHSFSSRRTESRREKQVQEASSLRLTSKYGQDLQAKIKGSKVELYTAGGYFLGRWRIPPLSGPSKYTGNDPSKNGMMLTRLQDPQHGANDQLPASEVQKILRAAGVSETALEGNGTWVRNPISEAERFDKLPLGEPANIVKQGEEGIWKRAKKQVKKQYPDVDTDSDRFYKLTTSIFKDMRKGKKSEAEERSMSKVSLSEALGEEGVQEGVYSEGPQAARYLRKAIRKIEEAARAIEDASNPDPSTCDGMLSVAAMQLAIACEKMMLKRSADAFDRAMKALRDHQ